MRRIVILCVVVSVTAVVFWSMIQSLETEPIGRDEPPAIILRAPDGYAVEELGTVSLAAAASILDQLPGDRVGARFTEQGDTVILLADHVGDRVVEMRASQSGTIVERQWQGDVDRRLGWAAEHGNLEAPGLPPPTGKNLYH